MSGFFCTEVLCPFVASPINGNATTTGKKPGDNVTYTCNEGYDLVGEADQTCLINGSWSGLSPSCNGKHPYSNCPYWFLNPFNTSEKESARHTRPYSFKETVQS